MKGSELVREISPKLQSLHQDERVDFLMLLVDTLKRLYETKTVREHFQAMTSELAGTESLLQILKLVRQVEES